MLVKTLVFLMIFYQVLREGIGTLLLFSFLKKSFFSLSFILDNSITTSSSSLIFSYTKSNLVLIPSSILFILDIATFISTNSIGISFLYLPCLYLIFHTWVIVIITVLISLLILTSVSPLCQFQLIDFSLYCLYF